MMINQNDNFEILKNALLSNCLDIEFLDRDEYSAVSKSNQIYIYIKA